jgi:hypothetical protein
MNVNTQGETSHIVRLVFQLLARLFPYRPPPGYEHVTAAQLRPLFKKWEFVNVLLLFACAPFAIWGAKALLAACLPPPPAPAGALHHLTIDPMFFVLPGIFLGLILAAAPVMGLLRLLLRDRFPEYVLYGNLLTGFDTVKIWLWLSVVVAIGSYGLAYAAAEVHLTVFSDRIELRHFGLNGPVAIPAAQVKAASVDANGVLHFKFSDGTSWSTSEDLSLLSPTPEQSHAIAARFPAAR